MVVRSLFAWQSHLWHAVRAELLRRSGQVVQAKEADREALARTTNQAERRLLLARIAD